MSTELVMSFDNFEILKVDSGYPIHRSWVDDINMLVDQLFEGQDVEESRIDSLDFKDIANQKNKLWLLVSDISTHKIVGMGILFCLDVPGDRLGYFDRFVVLESHRRLGIGKKMMEIFIEYAKKNSIGHFFFLSNPSRVEAHALYKSMEFETYNTTYFYMDL